MSLKATDFLADLIDQLSYHYDSIYLTRQGEPQMRLDDHPNGGSIVLASAAEGSLRRPKLQMLTMGNDFHRVTLVLKQRDDDTWDVVLEEGTKTDELNVSDLLGALKETYS